MGSLVESKWCDYVMVKANSHLKLLTASILDTYTKSISILIWCPLAYSSSLTQLYPPYLAQIVGYMGSLVELTWCDYVIVEADSHVKLLPRSILHIYKVFEHIGILSIGTHYTHPTCLRLGVLGYLFNNNDVIRSWLRLTAPSTSNCFLHPF